MVGGIRGIKIPANGTNVGSPTVKTAYSLAKHGKNDHVISSYFSSHLILLIVVSDVILAFHVKCERAVV